MSTQEQRERFEAFAIRRNMGAERISCGRYKSSFTQAMFESWLAAEAAAIERCAAMVEPKNPPDDWTEYARIKAECANAIRALLPKEE